MIATQPANGTAQLQGADRIQYQPNPDFFGTDVFTYTLTDGNGGSATGTVTVTVAPLQDLPVADGLIFRFPCVRKVIFPYFPSFKRTSPIGLCLAHGFPRPTPERVFAVDHR